MYVYNINILQNAIVSCVCLAVIIIFVRNYLVYEILMRYFVTLQTVNFHELWVDEWEPK